MHVAFLTTWGSKCGISTYSEELCECLIDADLKIQVLAPMEENSGLNAPEGIPFRLSWNRNDPNLPLTVPALVRDCDIVHIQHEYGLFQHHDAFIQLLRVLKKNEIKTVVTLHTVYPYGDWRSGVVDSIRCNADAIIAHTPEAYASVSLSRGSSRLVRIHHGTRSNVPHGNRETGFDFLCIPRQFRRASFGGVIGFISPGKNIHETIMAWSDATARRLVDPGTAGLIVAGQSDENMFYYRKQLDECKRDCGFAENIFIVDKFIPRNMMNHVLSVFDYAILNTTSNTLSASGQVHALAAHGVPFAAANRPIYRDGIGAGAISYPLDKDNHYTIMTVNAVASLANSPEIRDEIKQSMIAYAAETSWKNQAAKHIKLYKELLS